MMRWKTLKSRYSYQDKWLRLRTDTVRLPNGTVLDDFHIVEFTDWTAVLAFSQTGQLILTREYRHGAEDLTTGLPGGRAEEDETDLLAVAKRELAEETGYSADEWISLGRAFSNWSNQNNKVHFFLALDAKETQSQKLDQSEEINILFSDYDEVFNLEGMEPLSCHQLTAMHLLGLYFEKHPSVKRRALKR